MPFKIQAPASGLLAFLKMVTGGRAPADLLEQVSPTIEMQEFYASDRLEIVSESAALTVPATAVLVSQSVPSGERWRLHALAAQLSGFDLTGDTVLSTPFVRMRPAGDVVVPIQANNPLTISSTSVVARTGDFVQPFILPPGAQIGAQNILPITTATAATMTTVALIERIDF